MKLGMRGYEKNPVYHVNFQGVEFHSDSNQHVSGSVTFEHYKFPKGDVSFKFVNFGRGLINFDGAEFGDGNVSFFGAVFGDGNVDFRRAKFGKGNVFFAAKEFQSRSLNFNGVSINGNFLFLTLRLNKTILPIEEIDFSHMFIDGYLALGNFKTNAVIDLTHSKIGQTVQLDEPDIDYQKAANHSGCWPLRYHKAKKADAARCFRILKKYAEDAKDHERKLDFFANEMRSDYGYVLTGMKLYLYLLYDKISDYGRSFIRPAIGLLGSTLLFSIIYLALSLTQSSHKPIVFSGAAIINAAQSLFGDAFMLAAAHTVPFTFGSRAASKEAMTYLFDGVCHSAAIWMHGVTMVQGVISTIFLFLMGLALRNFFRS